jgi:hypothetical protein
MGGWKKEAKTIYRNKFTPPLAWHYLLTNLPQNSVVSYFINNIIIANNKYQDGGYPTELRICAHN